MMAKWYQKKRYYVPVAFTVGILGASVLNSLLGDKLRAEYETDYYKKKELPIFIKK